jgi:hypothetical protein
MNSMKESGLGERPQNDTRRVIFLVGRMAEIRPFE